MEPVSQPNRAVQIRYCRNIDEQALLLDAWNQNYCQISRGVFDGAVSLFGAGGVKVLVERLNRTVYQRGQVLPSRLAVGVPFELEGHALLCGQTSHRDGLHLFSGEGGIEFLSPDRHVVVNLEIEPDAIRDAVVRSQLDDIRTLLGARPGVLNVDPVQLQAFRQVLKQILDTVADRPALLDDTGVAAAFEKSVIFGLADALRDVRGFDSQGHVQARHAQARLARSWQLVRRVRDLVEASPECPLSVAELCARFRASRRTLQYAFEETLGVNPSAYIRAVRLDHVRRELRHAASVTEVATRWGFWHFGNFSSEYRGQFGELPSDTWRRCRAQAA
ncbi:helix-turn-helix domain-containing protein [Paraburkholderia azotifigens]|uniref:Helix-turn-helix domain-containing protein n=1 Tax=Paraburkholderia azotifigens TaxID=2057004 RepID=A0A5C6V4Z6_9BURK|nr:helix-turn-helix domain-containing protein [Paraburkholderia azotifigens]TXC79556.1 helix-turn-helix domain-containing protein [Paraburkholderia azotifigens]